MEKIWLKSYPPGVPHDVNPEQYRSVAHLLEESFRKHAKSPFSVCMDRWMNYGELERLSGALGAYLQGLGLQPGARVAIMLPNIPQFGVTMAAVLRAGYTCVNVNPLYTARELEHQLKDSGATAIVILENFAHTLADVVDHTNVQHVVMASMGDLLGFWFGKWITFAVRHLAKMVPAYELPLTNGRKVVSFKKALALGERRTLAPSTATLDSIAFLQYTGGTTGLSKGAVLTHRNIVAATWQAEAWFTPALAKIGDVTKANSIAALPLYHIFALTLCLLAIRQGSSLTLIPNPRDIPKFVAELKKRPFHMLPAVNTLFNALLQNAQFRALDFSHLCVSQAGGMAASEGTAKQWQKVTGSTMIEGWGMSETCAIGTTGLSKGAVLTHRNIVAATLQAEAWFTPALSKVGDLSKANSIAALPLYHIFALTLCLLAIRQGSSLTLIPNPRDIPKFIAELKKRPFHMLPAVNTLFNALLQNPQFKTLDFSHLCVSQAGGHGGIRRHGQAMAKGHRQHHD